jgi:transposase
MQTFRLNSRQRRQLRAEVKAAKDARSVRRAIALLELDEGQPAAQVAAMLGVTRQTLYNWRERLEAEGVPSALRDRVGRGRPTVWTEPVLRFLEWSLKQPPEALGYASANWTTALLREHLTKWSRVRVSDTTLRAQLHQLGYAWKRFRYVLQPDPDREKKQRPAGFPKTWPKASG